MKKIIGLLLAGIICVGLAFTLGNDGKVKEESISMHKQESVDENAKESDNEEVRENITGDADENTAETLNNQSEKEENIDIQKDMDKPNISEDKVIADKSDNNSVEPEKKETITIAINAQKAIEYGIRNQDGFGHLPSNGVILGTTTVEIKDGDTVYDVLAKVVRDKKIHMEYTGAGSSIYIQGIDNLYEFDCGSYSGWMYEVNGIYPNYGVGAYTLKAGDKITFNYTCDLGADLGAGIN